MVGTTELCEMEKFCTESVKINIFFLHVLSIRVFVPSDRTFYFTPVCRDFEMFP